MKHKALFHLCRVHHQELWTWALSSHQCHLDHSSVEPFQPNQDRPPAHPWQQRSHCHWCPSTPWYSAQHLSSNGSSNCRQEWHHPVPPPLLHCPPRQGWLCSLPSWWHRTRQWSRDHWPPSCSCCSLLSDLHQDRNTKVCPSLNSNTSAVISEAKLNTLHSRKLNSLDIPVCEFQRWTNIR